MKFRWPTPRAGCNPHPPGRRYNPIAVNPLAAITRLFVNTFGITQPSPENEEKAGRVILAMLIGVVLMLAVVGWVLRAMLVR